MIKRILDTDHMSLLERGHQPIQAQLSLFSPNTLAVSVITVKGLMAHLFRPSRFQKP